MVLRMVLTTGRRPLITDAAVYGGGLGSFGRGHDQRLDCDNRAFFRMRRVARLMGLGLCLWRSCFPVFLFFKNEEMIYPYTSTLVPCLVSCRTYGCRHHVQASNRVSSIGQVRPTWKEGTMKPPIDDISSLHTSKARSVSEWHNVN